MDSLITAAARALQAGDPLGALKRIALRNDAPALALRGIAMAQLGELAKARVLLRRAARSFGPRERVERARCATAEAEVALAARDLHWPTHALDAARRTFGALGDHDNELHAAPSARPAGTHPQSGAAKRAASRHPPAPAVVPRLPR